MEGCDVDAVLWLMEKRARAGPDLPISRWCFTSRHIIKWLQPLSGYTWPHPACASCRQIPLTVVLPSSCRCAFPKAFNWLLKGEASGSRSWCLFLSCFVLQIEIIRCVFCELRVKSGSATWGGRADLAGIRSAHYVCTAMLVQIFLMRETLDTSEGLLWA